MNGRILVVDDDRAMCDMVAADLGSRGHEVVTTRTATDAWEKRGAERPLGEVATAFVRQELTGCEWVLLVVGDERDNFGRLLAGVLYLPRCDDLWTILNDGIDLGARLIDKGYATPYVRDVVDVVDGPIQPVPAGWEA